MSKKKKAPQHAKKSRLRQRFERRLTKENDTGAWQQEDEAVGRAVDAALCVIENGVQEAQNRFN